MQMFFLELWFKLKHLKSMQRSHWRCSVKKVFLEILQNSQKNICARPNAYNFTEKETLGEVFSCEFCEISKKTFSTEHPRTTV